jgi:hypothetical protein
VVASGSSSKLAVPSLQRPLDDFFGDDLGEYATTGSCTNPKCSFAHNPGQLRATGKFFKASSVSGELGEKNTLKNWIWEDPAGIFQDPANFHDFYIFLYSKSFQFK